MIIGIGTDIQDNRRFASAPDGLLRKLFTLYELEEAGKRSEKAEYYGSRFAAKEAISKALGTGFIGLSPLDIEIREDENGTPYSIVKGRENIIFHLSISHEKEYSIAMAVAENG